MRAGTLGQGLGAIAIAVMTMVATQGTADAAQHRSATHGVRKAGFERSAARAHAFRGFRPSWQRSALQCVPFARENSGIELSGNAGTWWGNAEGLYERGSRPEVGSVLNFRSSGRIRMGHVAVVTNVISSRHVEIDHANWSSPGRISRDIDVVDVSPNNDWTQVRVALDRTEDYGSIYPTYGFIYDRPDHGTMVANNAPLPVPALRAIPDDRVDVAAAAAPEEVAEAEDDTPAPRYSAYRHRSHLSSKAFATHTASSRRTASAVSANTYRVSTRGTVAAKPHKATRRHF